tara:strand:- start:7397 stop:7582 length:186 start_codon:yes stop_codon:yes gene_type:complete
LGLVAELDLLLAAVQAGDMVKTIRQTQRYSLGIRLLVHRAERAVAEHPRLLHIGASHLAAP